MTILLSFVSTALLLFITYSASATENQLPRWLNAAGILDNFHKEGCDGTVAIYQYDEQIISLTGELGQRRWQVIELVGNHHNCYAIMLDDPTTEQRRGLDGQKQAGLISLDRQLLSKEKFEMEMKLKNWEWEE